jgi:hypothetical protein
MQAILSWPAFPLSSKKYPYCSFKLQSSPLPVMGTNEGGVVFFSGWGSAPNIKELPASPPSF